METRKIPLRILLTDDDEGDRLVFKEIFEDMPTDSNVQMVNNGEQLMDFLNTTKKPLPDIIFLDLNMPNMNGIECLKKIRSKEKYNDISIAIYSTSTSEKDVEETFVHGANVYITKPSDYKELKKVLAKAVSAAQLNMNSNYDRSNFVLKL